MIRLNKKVIAMGGGTGTYTVLSGLKKCDVVELVGILTMADSGGSSGDLRDQLGVLPPGDILQGLIALSDAEPEWRQMLEYRFTEGTLDGHRVGNIVLAALEKYHHDPLEGIRIAHKLLQVKGTILPVTSSALTLEATLENGDRIRGEHMIDNSTKLRSPIKSCALVDPHEANPEVIEAIETADLIVIGPGDLYTSVVPVLLVPGVAEALARTKAKKAYVVNLMTKRGQTEGYTVTRFLQTVRHYAEPANIDFVIVNSAVPSDEIVALYATEGEEMVEDDFNQRAYPLNRVCRWPLLGKDVMSPVKGDRLRRSYVRHDQDKTAAAILSLIRE